MKPWDWATAASPFTRPAFPSTSLLSSCSWSLGSQGTLPSQQWSLPWSPVCKSRIIKELDLEKGKGFFCSLKRFVFFCSPASARSGRAYRQEGGCRRRSRGWSSIGTCGRRVSPGWRGLSSEHLAFKSISLSDMWGYHSCEDIYQVAKLIFISSVEKLRSVVLLLDLLKWNTFENYFLGPRGPLVLPLVNPPVRLQWKSGHLYTGIHACIIIRRLIKPTLYSLAPSSTV